MTIYAHKYMQKMDVFGVISIRMFVTALVVIGRFCRLRSVPRYSIQLFVISNVAIISKFLWMMLSFYNIKRFGAMVSAMTSYAMPIVTGFGGWLQLDKQVIADMLVGVVLISVGIGLINRESGQIVNQSWHKICV